MSIADKLLTIANNTHEVLGILAPPKTVSGSVISVGDVSPIEHSLDVRLRSKNLLDISKLVTTPGKEVVNNGEGTLTVNGYGVNSIKKIRELCPSLKVGDIVTIAFTTTSSVKQVYLSASKEYWTSGSYITVTEDMLNSALVFYCKRTDGVNSPATIYNMRVSLGKTAFPYTPYISDFSAVNVSGYGKNLFDENKLIKLGLILQEDGRYYDYSTKSYVLWENIDGIKGSFNISAKIEYVGGQGKGFEIRTTYTDGTFMWGVGITDSSKMVGKVELVNAALRETWISNILITADVSSNTYYEPYKEPQTITANAEGIIQGLKSVSPNMTLISDADSVVIECTYRSSDSPEGNEKYTELQNAFARAKKLLK